MHYEAFRRLLGRGEKQTCDFKIECHAFASPTREPKAELLKDICALANNRRESYLIIGVSNDRKSFKSVTNTKLTDDNLQHLCQRYLSPNPRVHLEAHEWGTSASPEHQGVRFVIIRIGPSPTKRDVYRFALDFIGYKEGFAFKKNEVWVRRNTTSGLATPEEVGQLLRGQEAVDASQASVPNVVYSELPSGDVLNNIVADVQAVVLANDGTLDDWQVVLPMHGMKVSLGLVLMGAQRRRFQVWESVRQGEAGEYNHGALVICDDSVSPSALDAPHSRQFKKPWGHFIVYERPWRHMNVPQNTSEFKTFSVVIPKAVSRHKLQDSLNEAISFMSSEATCAKIFEEVISTINKNAREWAKKGRYTYPIRLRPPTKARPRDLKDDQVWVPSESGEGGTIFHVSKEDRDIARFKKLVRLNRRM